MRLSEFEVLQLAATLVAPYASRYVRDDQYVEHMFYIAEAIKSELEKRKPKGSLEIDLS